MNYREMKSIIVIIENLLKGYGFINNFDIKKNENGEIVVTVGTGLSKDNSFKTKVTFTYSQLPMFYNGKYEIICTDCANNNRKGIVRLKDLVPLMPIKSLIIKEDGSDIINEKVFFVNEREDFILIEKANNLSVKYIDDKEKKNAKKK